MVIRTLLLFANVIIGLTIGCLLFLDRSYVEAAPSTAMVTTTPTSAASPTRNNGQTSTRVTNPSATPRAEFQTYVIQTGDNVYLIAKKVYGDSSKYNLILSANNLNENSRLLEGMLLKIPVLAKPTATPTLSPTITVVLTLPTRTATLVPWPTATTLPGGPIDPNHFEEDPTAVMAMLVTFATSTLLGSTIICVFLAFVIYTSTRRISRQQAMARRVRPPLVR